jgi:hypothetical protein
MPIDDGVVIAEKVGGQRPIRALDAHVIEQIAVLAGGEGTVGKGDPDLFPLAVLLEMIFQSQEMGGRGVGVPWEKVWRKSWKPSFHSCVSSESRKVSTNCLYSELEVPKDSRP